MSRPGKPAHFENGAAFFSLSAGTQRTLHAIRLYAAILIVGPPHRSLGQFRSAARAAAQAPALAPAQFGPTVFHLRRSVVRWSLGIVKPETVPSSLDGIGLLIWSQRSNRHRRPGIRRMLSAALCQTGPRKLFDHFNTIGIRVWS